jgi:hypothetical protein
MNRTERITAEASSAPRLGPTFPAFGLAKDQGRRIEITFLMRNGGMLTAIEEMEDSLTEEMVRAYGEKLAREVGAGATRIFADGWSASGQCAWINLGEVVGFSVRPAK